MEDLLLDGDVPAETQRDFVERMRGRPSGSTRVLRDLLDFARPEGGADATSGPPAPADVPSVVEDVVALVRTQKSFRDVRLDVDIEGEPVVVLPGPGSRRSS